jgi:transposase
MGAMPNKTGRDDARAIAQIMRTGWFRAVHVKTSACRSWRSLLVARRTVLNEMRPIENVVRAILREPGLKTGTPARKDFVVRAREPIGGEDGLARMIEPLLAIPGVMLREFARLTKQVLDAVRNKPVWRRLMSAPGAGPMTALAFRAAIDWPERFRKSRDAGAHLEFDPATLSIRRNRRPGPGQPMRRRAGAHGAPRSSPFSSGLPLKVTGPASVGHEDRQTPWHGESQGRGRPQGRGHSSPDVGRRRRVPVRE